MEFILRSKINEWKKEYADTINGMEISTFDVMEANGYFDRAVIIEDEEDK